MVYPCIHMYTHVYPDCCACLTAGNLVTSRDVPKPIEAIFGLDSSRARRAAGRARPGSWPRAGPSPAAAPRAAGGPVACCGRALRAAAARALRARFACCILLPFAAGAPRLAAVRCEGFVAMPAPGFCTINRKIMGSLVPCMASMGPPQRHKNGTLLCKCSFLAYHIAYYSEKDDTWIFTTRPPPPPAAGHEVAAVAAAAPAPLGEGASGAAPGMHEAAGAAQATAAAPTAPAQPPPPAALETEAAQAAWVLFQIPAVRLSFWWGGALRDPQRYHLGGLVEVIQRISAGLGGVGGARVAFAGPVWLPWRAGAPRPVNAGGYGGLLRPPSSPAPAPRER